VTLSPAAALTDLVEAAHRLARLAAAETGETTSSTAYRTLSILLDRGPSRIGDLAVANRISQPGMSKVVVQLEDSGWVRREADPGDARAAVVVLTEAGAAARAGWLERIGRVLEPRFADLDEADRAALERTAQLLRSRTGGD
jgi:DNA-binding MarR family transcriptional regulator